MSIHLFHLQHANGSTETVSIREMTHDAAAERVKKLYPDSTILWAL